MNVSKLMREIHKEITNSRIPDINAGGCGYFAFFMANELERYGIEYNIRVVDGFESIFYYLPGHPIKEKVTNIENFIHKVDEISKELVSFTHCWVEIKDGDKFRNIDSESFDEELNKDEFNFNGVYTKEELKTALRYGGWNREYNKQNNQKLRAAIRKAFESMHILRLLPTV